MSHSSSIYIDDVYFKDKMGENIDNNEYSSYPINLKAFRLGWLLMEEDGKKLL